MILLFSSVWWSIRFFSSSPDKHIKTYFFFGLKLCGIVLLGFAFALPIFAEQLRLLLNGARVTGDFNTFKFQLATENTLITTLLRSLSNVLTGINEMPYGSNFYEAPLLYTGLISWFGLIGYTVYWCKKKSVTGLAYLVTILLIVLFPNTISVVMNGFSDTTSRWYFVLVPVQCYLAAQGIQFILSDRITRIWTLCCVSVILLFIGYHYLMFVLPAFATDTSKQMTAFTVLGLSAILFVIIFVLLEN